jgi:hypothetical protein
VISKLPERSERRTGSRRPAGGPRVEGVSWARAGAVALILLAGAAGEARAQTSVPRPETAPALVRHGKWVTAAFAIGFTALGIRAHHGADADFRRLVDYCQVVGGCAIGPDGRYANSEAEARYQTVVRGDRAARAWLLGGQAAFAGSVVLWIMELNRVKGPRNIPYSPFIVAPGRHGTRLGLRLAW